MRPIARPMTIASDDDLREAGATAGSPGPAARPMMRASPVATARSAASRCSDSCRSRRSTASAGSPSSWRRRSASAAWMLWVSLRARNAMYWSANALAMLRRALRVRVGRRDAQDVGVLLGLDLHLVEQSAVELPRAAAARRTRSATTSERRRAAPAWPPRAPGRAVPRSTCSAASDSVGAPKSDARLPPRTAASRAKCIAERHRDAGDDRPHDHAPSGGGRRRGRGRGCRLLAEPGTRRACSCGLTRIGALGT